MTAPSIDPSDVITPTLSSVEAGVSENLGPIGLVAGALLAVGIVWRLGRKMVKA